MPSEVIELFAVCAVEDIERGDARAFSLSRIDETGESRPFPILIVRTHANGYFGYVNSCPHEGIWLNFGEGDFFTPDRTFLKCGRHGSIFEIETGLCIEAPCEERSLEPLALAVVDGAVCVSGIALVEDDAMPDPYDELDDTREIMIHPH